MPMCCSIGWNDLSGIQIHPHSEGAIAVVESQLGPRTNVPVAIL